MNPEKLAVDGGTPLRTAPFPSWPISDEREENHLMDVLRTRKWSVFSGDKVKTFQERFASYQNARFATCVPNGTLALLAAFMAVGIGPGDEVIAPAYTFIASISPALLLGAKLVLVDIDPNTYTLDPNLTAEAITSRTKAIVPVHLAGHPADLDALLEIAREHGLRLIEDACQAWGAEWKGERVGALGDLGAFSFQLGKNLTAGEGGALVTNDTDLHERVWSLHNVGRTRTDPWYHHEILGLNLRMTEWQGAVLLAQLERLEEHYDRREANARSLEAALAEVDGISPLHTDPRVTRHARHLVILRYDANKFGGHTLPEFLKALHAEGISPAHSGYVPLHKTHAIRKEMQARFGIDPAIMPLHIAEEAGERTFWISQEALLGDLEDMQDIAAAMAKIQRIWS